MKLKTLVASMAVLGLASTGALAAAPAQAGSLQTDAFWQNIIHHNQDNASGVQMLQTGKNAVSGSVDTQIANTSKRTSYNKETENDKGSTLFSLHRAELYFDARPASNVDVHVAADYDNNFNNNGATQMFFPEANVSLTYGDMWATIGQQYGNFGSVDHHSITTPVTESFTSMNQTGVTLGYAMRDTGLYGDVFLYNGATVGLTSNAVPTSAENDPSDIKKYNDSKNTAHGYSAEIGFAQNQGANALFGNNGVNVALSYISNIQDVMTFAQSLNTLSSGTAIIKSAVPAYSLHADYTMGSFSIDADYVMVNKMKNTGWYVGKLEDGQLTGASAKAPTPSAYSLQGVYGFTTAGQHNNYVTLGFGGTQDALGVTPFAGSFGVPAQRILVNYKYDMMKNVNVELEYDMDTDYGKTEGSGYSKTLPEPATSFTDTNIGTGESKNTITARLNVSF